MIAVVSLHRQAYSGHARQVIEAAIATTRFKWFVVVDGDVDVFNWEEVEWALAMHVQPHRDVIVTDDRHRGSNVDPSIPPTCARFQLHARRRSVSTRRPSTRVSPGPLASGPRATCCGASSSSGTATVWASAPAVVSPSFAKQLLTRPKDLNWERPAFD